MTLEHAQHAFLTYPEQSATPAKRLRLSKTNCRFCWSKSATVKTLPVAALELPPQSKRTDRNKWLHIPSKNVRSVAANLVSCYEALPKPRSGCNSAVRGHRWLARQVFVHVDLYSQRILLITAAHLATVQSLVHLKCCMFKAPLTFVDAVEPCQAWERHYQCPWESWRWELNPLCLQLQLLFKKWWVVNALSQFQNHRSGEWFGKWFSAQSRALKILIRPCVFSSSLVYI